MVYRKLFKTNHEYAEKIHSRNTYKFYTISSLYPEDQKKCKNGLDFTNAYFYISSPDKKFIKNAVIALLMDNEFTLKNQNGNIDFVITSAISMHNPEFSSGKLHAKTLSPIYVKKTEPETNKDVDLYPDDQLFFERLEENLINRYQTFFDKELKNPRFKIRNISNVKTKRINIKSYMHRCSLMNLTIEGDPELIEFAYDSGLGLKNAMGFGCIELKE